MGIRPGLRLLIGLTDLGFDAKALEITDPRYRPPATLSRRMWGETPVPIEDLKKHIPESHHMMLGNFLTKDEQIPSIDSVLHWNAEMGLGNVIGLKTTEGIYDNYELWAIASCFPALQQGGFHILPEKNMVKSVIFDGNIYNAYALFREVGFDIRIEDLRLFLYWQWS